MGANTTHGGPRPGAGRKPLGDRAATERVMLRLTPAELAVIVRAAERAQVPISVYVREAALRAARSKNK